MKQRGMKMADILNVIPRCCSSCEYLYHETTAEPCFNCKGNNKWIPNAYLKHLDTIEKEKSKNG